MAGEGVSWAAADGGSPSAAHHPVIPGTTGGHTTPTVGMEGDHPMHPGVGKVGWVAC